jgi:hypothetical protein
MVLSFEEKEGLRYSFDCWEELFTKLTDCYYIYCYYIYCYYIVLTNTTSVRGRQYLVSEQFQH